MIRSLIIIFNLFIAMFIKIIADGPTATVKVPASVKAGEAFLVEVTIQPNGETSFMRYSMQLPDGWTAEQVSTDGGTFKFDKQSASVKWLSVSGKTELKISFNVTIPANAAGGQISIANKLSHPVNNQPSNIDLDPVLVNVEAASSATTYNTTHSVPDSTAKPPAEVTIERVVPTDPVSGEFVVTINIHKDDLVSFGKIEDTLPSGFTATLLKSDGADFKFENGVARFGWYAGMPKKSTLNVQYKVTVSPDMSGNEPIAGHFSYVENEKGKVINVSTSIVSIKPKEVVVKQTTPVDTTSVANTGNTTSHTDNTSTGNTDNSSTAKTGNSTSNTDNSSSSNSGNTASNNSSNPDTTGTTDNSVHSTAKSAGSIVFSVQIAAMSRLVPISYYQNTFNISGTINTEQDNGLNKYTTGSFGSYQEARDHRNEVRGKGVSDAFVTAYNGGKRITVQEALMITSQKWVL